MIQLLIPILICAAAPSAAPSTRPSTRPATTRPATPNLRAMQIEAFQLLQQSQPRKAAPILEKAYKETPPALRNRALVMNHAILDLTQKTYVMRGLKDLTDYLVKNRDPDEHATNVLGGALNLAVTSNPRLRQGALWQSALREWDRRNYVLDHSRKGWRRWGTRWLSEVEYAQVQADIAGLKRAVEEQGVVVERAYQRALTLSQQYDNALRERDTKAYLVAYLNSWNPGSVGRLNTNISDSNFMQNQPSPLMEDAMAAEAEARRLGPEMEIAMREFHREDAKLKELQNKVIRPEWPTTFEPVDPAGPEADKPIDKGPPPSTAPARPIEPGLRPLPPR